MQRRKQRVTVLLAAVMAAITLGAGGQPAHAQESDQVPEDEVFGLPLDEYLAQFPDATQLPDGSYQLAPGQRLNPPVEDAGAGIAPRRRSDASRARSASGSTRTSRAGS